MGSHIGDEYLIYDSHSQLTGRGQCQLGSLAFSETEIHWGYLQQQEISCEATCGSKKNRSPPETQTQPD